MITNEQAEAPRADQTSSVSLGLCKDLALSLAKFPRVRLGHMPTPLEPMDRLSERLGHSSA